MWRKKTLKVCDEAKCQRLIFIFEKFICCRDVKKIN